MEPKTKTAEATMNEADLRDLEVMEGVKLAGIALGIVLLAGLLSAGGILIG